MRRKSKRTHALPKYMKKRVERANKVMEEWKKQGYTTNDLKIAEKLFKDFYKEYGKRVKENTLPSKNILVTKREQQEYNKILNFVLLDENLDMENRKRIYQNAINNWDASTQSTFKKLQKEYDLEDEQAFFNFTDNLNRFKNNRMLSSILSSDQIAHLWGYGSDKGMQEQDVEKLVIKEYKKSGTTGDYLYEKILDMINEKEGE